jgi:hypothetical protein
VRGVVERPGNEVLGAADRQLGDLTAQLLDRLLLLVLDLPLPLLDEILRLFPRFRQQLGTPARISWFLRRISSDSSRARLA